ncbi:hypothetical protein ABT140_28120, partial [Streptomyces californicus]
AFLIAWTVPEMAATLLIEDGMALLLVPATATAVPLPARLARCPTGPPGGAHGSRPVGAASAVLA